MSNLKFFLFSIFTLFIMIGCEEPKEKQKTIDISTTNNVTNEIDDETNQTNISRAIWQQPNLVIEKLGDVNDKVIADIGAGIGYFAFKLADKSQKVIAVDIDQTMLNYIDSTKNTLPITIRNKIETRLATSNDPKLKNNEVDIILIINTIAFIPNLQKYLSNLTKSLKNNGKIMIIDYKMKKLPINAPPKTERIYLDKLEDLLNSLGYRDINSDDTTLDYQYIIEAYKP